MRNKQSFSTNKSGISLLEVIIAMTISIILISGLVLATTTSIRNSQFAKSQTLATKFAQEAMEKVRAYRDQNTWATFTGGCTPYNPGAVPAQFTRIKTCSLLDPDKMQVIVTVSWTDPMGTHKSELTSYFSNQSLWK